MNFEGKTVLITGASSGIGSAIAAAFAQQGAELALVGRSRERLETAAALCRRDGRRAIVITADLTKEEDAARAVDETVTAFGKIDVLVNGAGAAATGTFQDENAVRVFDDIVATNLRSAVVCSHRALPHLIRARGNIVNISSVCATDVVRLTSWAYCVAKAGMDHFTRCVASELGPSGVRVNSVNPGAVRTNFWDYVTLQGRGMSEEGLYELLAGLSPMRKVCEPQEVADLVLYLAGDKAGSITGTAVLIDNGYKVRQ